jgi:hypothetical protein
MTEKPTWLASPVSVAARSHGAVIAALTPSLPNSLLFMLFPSALFYNAHS